MLEMKPDGSVVKRIALNSKTPVAAGLQFGPDGKMYVADVVGGAILKYDLSGGDPIAHYTGKTAAFNNVLGALVTQDGEISPPKAPTARCKNWTQAGTSSAHSN